MQQHRQGSNAEACAILLLALLLYASADLKPACRLAVPFTTNCSRFWLLRMASCCVPEQMQDARAQGAASNTPPHPALAAALTFVLNSIRALHCHADSVECCAKSPHDTAQRVHHPAYEVLGFGLAAQVHHLEHPAVSSRGKENTHTHTYTRVKLLTTAAALVTTAICSHWRRLAAAAAVVGLGKSSDCCGLPRSRLLSRSGECCGSCCR